MVEGVFVISPLWAPIFGSTCQYLSAQAQNPNLAWCHTPLTMTSSRLRATIRSQRALVMPLLYLLLTTLPFITAFSVPNESSAPFWFHRFHVTCPADPSCIRQYDASLKIHNDSDEVWAAVYRSNNNLPTVLLKDDFLNSMRMATSESSNNNNNLIENTRVKRETPVAVARLGPSPVFPNKYVLDTMRCWLKKEDLNQDCDGGSEHKEALSVAIDALLLHYLTEKTDTRRTSSKAPIFEQKIRTKATLVSSQLLEERGFQPVAELCQDMATHTSSLEQCLNKYANRTLHAPMKSLAQSTSLRILSKLGMLDQNAEMEAASRQQDKESAEEKDGGDDEYDPWAGIKQFI